MHVRGHATETFLKIRIGEEKLNDGRGCLHRPFSSILEAGWYWRLAKSTEDMREEIQLPKVIMDEDTLDWKFTDSIMLSFRVLAPNVV